MHADGTIEMCWGDGSVPLFEGELLDFVAGVEDDDAGVASPAVGAPFGVGGVAVPGEWPTNQCRSFSPDATGDYTTN